LGIEFATSAWCLTVHPVDKAGAALVRGRPA